MDCEKVVIIGAGPGGLAAAYEFIGSGIQPVMLEKYDKLGGLARTETFRGYHFDIGGHRFFTKNQKIKQLWRDMLGKDFIKVSRLSRIYYNGQFYQYPLEIFDTLYSLGMIESLRIMLSYLKVKVRPIPEEHYFDQWVSNRFGRRLYHTFFKTYTEKLWGIPPDMIRAHWAEQRIRGVSLISTLANAIMGRNETKSLISEFEYPLKGPGMMWERFGLLTEADGCRVYLNTTVTGVTHQNGNITTVNCVTGEENFVLPVKHLISSTPINRLIAMLEPKPPAEVLAAARNLTYRDFILVGLIIDKKDLFPDQWIYVHSPEVRVGRIQNFKNWSAAMAADSEKTNIGMEYFCSKGDEIWNASDSALIELASQELAKLGLASIENVLDGFVVRQSNAYPIYDQNYEKDLGLIREYVEGIHNLQTIGRSGMHRYNNMDHSMYTGILAAQNVLGSNHNLWEVNEEAEYLEETKEIEVEELISKEVFVPAFSRMDKLAFATATGSVCGLLFFLATIIGMIQGGKLGLYLDLLSNYFVGYSVSLKGAFIALALTFAWAFLFGWLFAYLRNLFISYKLYRVKQTFELKSFWNFIDQI